jgi:hypothetical protein
MRCGYGNDSYGPEKAWHIGLFLALSIMHKTAAWIQLLLVPGPIREAMLGAPLERRAWDLQHHPPALGAALPFTAEFCKPSA